MEIDKTTLKDLNIFPGGEAASLLDKINYTATVNGKDQLEYYLRHPLNTIEKIEGRQQSIQIIGNVDQKWRDTITNGTLLMIEKFYVTTVDLIPEHATELSALTYKMMSSSDYSLVKFSVGHCMDFLKGMHKVNEALNKQSLPPELHKINHEIKNSLQATQLSVAIENKSADALSNSTLLRLAHFLRYRYKNHMHSLLDQYARLDAMQSMATAAEKQHLQYPKFVESRTPVFEATGLFHPLVEMPVDYDISLSGNKNFLFLTGANMAGKSTFIKAAGIAVFLAHTGMAVPANSMQISLYHGVLSNINVEDNISKGQSYFYNEVRRVKDSILKINDGKPWFILFDELFKGTNVLDAMNCSSTVIEGLLKIKASTFILSTHLYEIGEALKVHPNIEFKYFETHTADGILTFSYKLKDGISSDRLGYTILKNEGVVDLLDRL